MFLRGLKSLKSLTLNIFDDTIYIVLFIEKMRQNR